MGSKASRFFVAGPGADDLDGAFVGLATAAQGPAINGGEDAQEGGAEWMTGGVAETRVFDDIKHFKTLGEVCGANRWGIGWCS